VTAGASRPQRTKERRVSAAGRGSGAGQSRRESGGPDPQTDEPAPGKRREAGARRSASALGVGAIIAEAARAGRRGGWRVLAVAVVVSVLTAAAEVVADDFADRTSLPLSLLTALSASGVVLLGTVFLSGFLSRLVREVEGGSERASVWTVVRTLPWGRLIGADLLVGLLVVAGLIALVIPGLAAIVFFAVVGPVIEIENRPVIAALRRSAHLVRRHFWPVALLVVLPLAVATGIFDSVAPHPDSLWAVLEILAIRGLAEALVEAAIGLILVELCYRLIALDRVQEPGQE
jgi:hypothetical protein